MSTPATVVMSESNGAGETITDGISGLSMGSLDAPDLVAADHPLVIPVIGNVYSYQKENRWKVTAWVDTTTVDNLKWFKSAGSNAANWTERYKAGGRTYLTPDRAGSGYNTIPWPTTAGTADAIGGTISNPTTGYPSGTTYTFMGVDIVAATAAGAKGTHTITFRYDES